MELNESVYEVAGKDEFFNTVLTYELTEIPDRRWTQVFNRKLDVLETKSIRDSKSIIVKGNLFTINNTDIVDMLEERIDSTDDELASDVLKEAIVLDKFIDGLIMLHGDLLYDENTQSESIILDMNTYMEDQDNNTQYEDWVPWVFSPSKNDFEIYLDFVLAL